MGTNGIQKGFVFNIGYVEFLCRHLHNPGKVSVMDMAHAREKVMLYLEIQTTAKKVDK